jgi:hypothetical protein
VAAEERETQRTFARSVRRLGIKVPPLSPRRFRFGINRVWRRLARLHENPRRGAFVVLPPGYTLTPADLDGSGQ